MNRQEDHRLRTPDLNNQIIISIYRHFYNLTTLNIFFVIHDRKNIEIDEKLLTCWKVEKQEKIS